MNCESYERALSQPPDVTKPHKFTKFFGLNWLLKKVHSIPHQEILHFRIGTCTVLTFTSLLAYYFYRRDIEARFNTGEGLAKIITSEPFDAGNQFYQNFKQNKMTYSASLFTRIQEMEFNAYYSLKKCFMTGYFDHTKEILFPRRKYGIDGYDVITPFYYYYMLRPDPFFTLKVDGKPENKMTSERAAIAVNRGWIPSGLKDRRLRPYDVNSSQEETIYGILKMSRKKGNHHFSEPNNPTYGVWKNFSLEDFAWYWDLPNMNSAKYVYFQEVNFTDSGFGSKDVYPNKANVEQAIIEENKDRGRHLDRNYNLAYKTLSFLSGGLFYIFYISF